MIEIERKTKTLVFSAVLALAVLSGIALTAYANDATNDTNTAVTTTSDNSDRYYMGMSPFFGGGRGCRGGRGGFGDGMITVSQEFKDNVTNIAKSDSDVQTLLSDGYNITEVRPIITTKVEADGTVTMKATSAIVMLTKDATGRALVWVNIEEAKVTRIEILTITVIEKP